MLSPKDCNILEQRISKRIESLIDEEELQKLGCKLIPLIIATLEEHEKMKNS